MVSPCPHSLLVFFFFSFKFWGGREHDPKNQTLAQKHARTEITEKLQPFSGSDATPCAVSPPSQNEDLFQITSGSRLIRTNNTKFWLGEFGIKLAAWQTRHATLISRRLLNQQWFPFVHIRINQNPPVRNSTGNCTAVFWNRHWVALQRFLPTSGSVDSCACSLRLAQKWQWWKSPILGPNFEHSNPETFRKCSPQQVNPASSEARQILQKQKRVCWETEKIHFSKFSVFEEKF